MWRLDELIWRLYFIQNYNILKVLFHPKAQHWKDVYFIQNTEHRQCLCLLMDLLVLCYISQLPLVTKKTSLTAIATREETRPTGRKRERERERECVSVFVYFFVGKRKERICSNWIAASTIHGSAAAAWGWRRHAQVPRPGGPAQVLSARSPGAAWAGVHYCRVKRRSRARDFQENWGHCK